MVKFSDQNTEIGRMNLKKKPQLYAVYKILMLDPDTQRGRK